MEFVSDELFELMAEDDYDGWCYLLSSSKIDSEFMSMLKLIKTKEQVAAVYTALRKNLNAKQIKTFLNSNFNSSQMQEIIWGYEHGLTEEEVYSYAVPLNYWGLMQQSRLKFEKSHKIEHLRKLLSSEIDSNDEKKIVIDC